MEQHYAPAAQGLMRAVVHWQPGRFAPEMARYRDRPKRSRAGCSHSRRMGTRYDTAHFRELVRRAWGFRTAQKVNPKRRYHLRARQAWGWERAGRPRAVTGSMCAFWPWQSWKVCQRAISNIGPHTLSVCGLFDNLPWRVT